MLRELFAHFLDLSLDMVGLEDCETFSAHLKNKMITTEKFLDRQFLATQQALGTQELDYVNWLPGLGNPADGLTKTKSDAALHLCLLESGARNPGALRPSKGLASNEQ